MFTLTETVKDGILEIRFSHEDVESKIYTITNYQDQLVMQGKITGHTQRSCLYVGDLKKGTYTFTLGEHNKQAFSIL
jgi:hypothetical protein